MTPEQFNVVKQQFTDIYIKSSAHAIGYDLLRRNYGKVARLGKYVVFLSSLATGAAGISTWAFNDDWYGTVTAILAFLTAAVSLVENTFSPSKKESDYSERLRALTNTNESIIDYLYRLSRGAITNQEDPDLTISKFRKTVDDTAIVLLDDMDVNISQATQRLGEKIASIKLLNSQIQTSTLILEDEDDIGQAQEEIEGFSAPSFNDEGVQ